MVGAEAKSGEHSRVYLQSPWEVADTQGHTYLTTLGIKFSPIAGVISEQTRWGYVNPIIEMYFIDVQFYSLHLLL